MRVKAEGFIKIGKMGFEVRIFAERIEGIVDFFSMRMAINQLFKKKIGNSFAFY